MNLYKYPVKLVAFIYGLVVLISDVFSRSYSVFRFILLKTSVHENPLKLVDEFAKVDLIKKRMEQCGYNNYSRYFRTRIMARDIYCPKTDYWPTVYIPGIPSEPFPKKEKFSWAKDFEKNYPIILDEFLTISQGEGIRPYHVSEYAEKQILENWSTFFFVDAYGGKREENIRKCPKTWELLNKVPRFVDNNMTMFSILDPHSRILEHTGWSNLFIRVHLALVNKEPSRVAINVGDEISGWIEGELLFLDDSFFHQVWNSSDHYRAVLFFDVWHPVFTDEEVLQLKSIYDKGRSSEVFKKLSDAAQEIEKKSMKKIFTKT